MDLNKAKFYKAHSKVNLATLLCKVHDLEVDALLSITNLYALHPMINIIPETASFIALLIGMCVRDYVLHLSNGVFTTKHPAILHSVYWS